MSKFIFHTALVCQFLLLVCGDDCKKASECPAVSKHVKKDGTLDEVFLADFLCGFEGPNPKYTCSLVPNNTKHDEIQPRFDMTEPCVTPNGVKGQCVELSKCPKLMSKITENPKYIRLAQRSKCESQGSETRFCCGDDEFDYECGVSYNENVDKIYGGNETKINEYPWMVLLIYTEELGGDRFRCGGTLINSQFVLTAAHCILNELIGVRVGVFKNNDKNGRYQDVAIKNMTIHESYVRRKTNYDIGLLKIERVKHDINVGWICLPTKDTAIPKKFMVVGYGNNDKGVDPFTIQYRASLPHVEFSTCKRSYRSKSYNSEVVLCAGGETGVDSCVGDSGGPLMSKADTPYWHLFGVVSGGYIECSLGKPGLYTRVGTFLDWIQNKMLTML